MCCVVLCVVSVFPHIIPVCASCFVITNRTRAPKHPGSKHIYSIYKVYVRLQTHTHIRKIAGILGRTHFREKLREERLYVSYRPARSDDCVCARTHTHKHARTHARTHLFIHSLTHTRTRTYTHTRILTDTHTHTRLSPNP